MASSSIADALKSQAEAGKMVMAGAFGETPEGALFVFKDATLEVRDHVGCRSLFGDAPGFTLAAGRRKLSDLCSQMPTYKMGSFPLGEYCPAANCSQAHLLVQVRLACCCFEKLVLSPQ